MTLNLQTYETLPASLPDRPETRRSPILALLLSLPFPGIGHLYLRSWRNGGWIIGIELLLLAFVAGASGQLHATAVFSAPCLYLFAIIDAYFSAREWNAGVTSWMTGASPRITAILNLLTKGFGYFYLGDRTKGIVCFLAMSAVQGALLARTNIWTVALAISLQVAVASDGYRIARERLLGHYPELRALPTNDDHASANVVDAANPGGVRPVFAMGFFALLGAAMLIGYIVLQALNGHTVVSNGSLEQGPDGLVYRNAREHLELTVPETWSPFSSPSALASLRGEGGSVLVQEQYATYTAANLSEQTEKVVRKNHPSGTFTPVTAKLAGRAVKGFEVSFKNSSDVAMQQRFVFLGRGLRIFILVETWTDAENRTALDRTEQSFRLNRSHPAPTVTVQC